MKKTVVLILAAIIVLFAFAACGKSNTYVCAGCGNEYPLAEGIEAGDDAVLYCSDCVEKLHIDDFEEGLVSQIRQYESEALSQEAEREGA